MADDDDLGLRVIPGYELLRPVGRGGMGVAYLARQLSLGRRVVVKFLGHDPEVDPIEQAARFRREAQLMASISHPNVATIFDFGIDDGRPYLVMEYVEGGDLRAQLVAGKPLPADRARRLLRGLVRALECLHNNGILHRDLKPENILMAGDDTPKVSDFGIAVSGDAVGSLTQSGRIVGTVGYLSPEQQYRLPVDERSDQYSLAALAYEFLTGQLPLGAFPPASRLNRRLHASVDAVLQRALAEDRNARYPTIREFGDALDRALGLPRRRRLLAISAAAALAAIALAVVRLGHGSPPVAPSPPRADAPRPAPPGRTTAPTTAPSNSKPAPDAIAGPASAPEGRDAGRPGGGNARDRDRAGAGASASKSASKRWKPPRRVVNSLGMTLLLIPPGEFLMGSPDGAPDAEDDERPRHRVRLIHPFYLGVYEVTVGQFRRFVEATKYKTRAEEDGKGGFVFDSRRGKIVNVPELNWRNPGLPRPQSDDEPVVQICWTDANKFCKWLTEEEGYTYHMPTEAEWEYACRAGQLGRWCFGDDPAALGDFAWFAGNSGHMTHPVGGKRPNAFGLFDMHGNAWEWCQDYYAPGYPPGEDVAVDPRGPPQNPDFEHVLRGGSLDDPEPRELRSAVRLYHGSGYRYYTFGFRVRRWVHPMAAESKSP